MYINEVRCSGVGSPGWPTALQFGAIPTSNSVNKDASRPVRMENLGLGLTINSTHWPIDVKLTIVETKNVAPKKVPPEAARSLPCSVSTPLRERDLIAQTSVTCRPLLISADDRQLDERIVGKTTSFYPLFHN